MATESTKTTQTGTEKSSADEPTDEAVTAKGKPDERADGKAGEPTKDAAAVNVGKEREDAVGDPDDIDDADFDLPDDSTERRSDWMGGALAVVSAGLGLAALTGTSLSGMLRERKSLLGQIESGAQGSGGSAADQVNAVYGAPWHAEAVVNGIFALLAVAVGGLLLATLSGRPEARGWVKAVSLGGVVLGAIGLVVAGGMYFDLFAAQPEVPSTPTPPGQ
ncbi:hypothetical protein ACQEU8_10625 [Streptomyces sp. CA-250714]|uniref:hypothetical protein n=1 Tax=Streptomyces sp. CA-250714 TaxID=3240060 RepID=UPI003D8B3958